MLQTSSETNGGNQAICVIFVIFFYKFSLNIVYTSHTLIFSNFQTTVV